MEKILIIGSSGHARVVIDIVEKQGLYTICGLIDSTRQVGEETLGYAVLGAVADLPRLCRDHGVHAYLIAIGDNFVRARVAEQVQQLCPELALACAVHPAASIGRDVVLGAGTVVMAGAVINPCCQVGRLCIVNTRASLDHDSLMEDFSSLAPGVSTGGAVALGPFTAVGVGATLRHGIHIGAHSVIGAGAVVMHALPAFTVAYGVPAKPVRERCAGEKYL